MKSLASLLVIAALSLSAGAQAQSPEDIAAAQKAAEAWLGLTDAGRYAQAYDEAAPAFQGMVTKPQWEDASRGVRTPLGAVSKRALQSANYSASLPGAPAGEYVVIEYRAEFANKANATEIVTPMRAPDGKWKVSGYYIR